ncbi:hypothetical protein Anas_06724 [Armadillidium nasatum]|uniref:Uncharacterized protein n=1 Tax=Armadillidium nasatum TaxID=96803 RepID=A0A5N5TGV6_9CRUS|nr:hypothetical protein Anas_06724 [Armadillidium nasatum]
MEELLKALPDGFLSTKPNAVQKPIESGASLEDSTTPQGMTLTSGFIENRISELEGKTSSLDFALINLQKKVFFNSHDISFANNASNSSSENCGQDLSNRLDEVEFELSKMKDSSKVVLDFLSEFEKRNGRSVKGVDDKLSIVETQIEKEIEDRTFYNIETKSDIIDTKSEIRGDYVELKNDISFIRAKLRSFEDSINRSKKSSIDTDQSILSKFNEYCLNIIRHENESRDQNVSDVEKRLKKVEKLVTKNSKFLHKRKRHKHGLKNY